MMLESRFVAYGGALRKFMGAPPELWASPAPLPAPASPIGSFGELALELFDLQYRAVEPYRRFCQGRRVTPEGVSDWRDIPALPVSAFKAGAVTSLPAGGWRTVFESSGTSGAARSRHYHSPESLAVYEASLLCGFARACGCPGVGAHGFVLPPMRAAAGAGGILFLVLTPVPAAAPESSLVHMFGCLCRAWGGRGTRFCGRVARGGAWALEMPVGRGALDAAVAGRRALFLLGTAFSLVHLLDALAGARWDGRLPAGSRVLETGGYKGRSRTLPKEALHAAISSVLGVPAGQILTEYGMSELSSQAYGRERLLFPPWARAAVVSPETGQEVAEGETGLLRVWDLANVRSVLALQTEDLAVRRGEGFELLGRASGAAPRGCSLRSGVVA